VGIALILLGVLVMASRRKALVQMVGLFASENGIFFTAMAISQGMPLIIEIGVILDVVLGALVMGILVLRVRSSVDHRHRRSGEPQGLADDDLQSLVAHAPGSAASRGHHAALARPAPAGSARRRRIAGGAGLAGAIARKVAATGPVVALGTFRADEVSVLFLLLIGLLAVAVSVATVGG